VARKEAQKAAVGDRGHTGGCRLAGGGQDESCGARAVAVVAVWGVALCTPGAGATTAAARGGRGSETRAVACGAACHACVKAHPGRTRHAPRPPRHPRQSADPRGARPAVLRTAGLA